MACAADQVYSPFNLAGSVTGPNQEYEIGTQAYTDAQVPAAVTNFGCATAKALFNGNHLFDIETSLPITIGSIGTGDFTMVGNSTLEAIGASLFVDNINVGVFSNAPGSGTITYMAVGPQPTFPLVMGVNCGYFKITTNNSVNGGWLQWNNVPAVVDRLTSINFEKWWCCAGVAGSGCTNGVGCGGGGNYPIGSFLLPTSSNPDPVAAQSTTPILNTPLYLSNHTFALTNNFGVTKQ